MHGGEIVHIYDKYDSYLSYSIPDNWKPYTYWGNKTKQAWTIAFIFSNMFFKYVYANVMKWAMYFSTSY